jgi:site-specific DNA recombinase
MYANDISKRVAVSRRLDMERGKFTGSNAPYGYKVDSTDAFRKYLVDEEAAAVVRQIFELAADGVTLRKIGRALQSYRLALPGAYLKTGNIYVDEGQEAKAWYAGTISNILKNQAYIGNMVQGKRHTRLSENESRHVTDEEDWIIVENTHETIVDKELFDRVRKVLAQKVEESCFSSDRGKNLPIKDDIFAGILFCGNCKRRISQLSRIAEKDGRLERQYFYSCRYNYDFGGEKCGCTILEQELVKAVYKILEVNIEALSDCEKMENVLQSTMDKELKQCDVQIRHLEKKIEKQNYEESKAYQGYVTGEESREEFRRMQEKSADAVMRLRGQISKEEADRRRYKRFFGKKLQWMRAIYRFQSEPYLDRNMLEHLVHSIYLYPDNRLEINLNFKDEYAERMKEEA